MKKTLTILFLLLICNSSSKGINTDSLWMVIESHSDAITKFYKAYDVTISLAKSHPTESHPFSIYAYNLADSLDLTKEKGKGLYAIGNSLFRMEQYSNAVTYFLNAKEKFTEIGELQLLGDTENALGLVHLEENSFELAERYFLSAKNIFIGNSDEEGINMINANLGIIHAKKGEIDKAIDLFIEAISYVERESMHKEYITYYSMLAEAYRAILEYEKSDSVLNIIIDILPDKSPRVQASTYTNIGALKGDMGMHEEAISYHQKVLDIGIEHNLVSFQSNSLKNLALCHTHDNNFTKATEYIKKSIALDISTKKTSDLGLSYVTYGHLYEAQGQYNDAVEYYLKSVPLLRGNKQSIDLRNVLSRLSFCYEELGKADKALIIYKAFYNLNDSLMNAEIIKSTKLAENRYTLNKKETELKEKDLKLNVTKAQNKLKNTQLQFLLVGLTIVFIISWIFRRQRNKVAKQKEMIELLNEDLSHRTGHIFDFISSYILSIRKHKKDKEEVDSVLEELESRIDGIYSGFNLMKKNISHSKDDLETHINLLFGVVENSIVNDSQTQIDFRIDISCGANNKYITLINIVIMELVRNSILYAFGDKTRGIVKVQLSKINGIFELIVTDNGNGKKEDFHIPKGTGIGIKVIRRLVEKQFGGTFDISHNNGTTTKLTFPEISK